MPVGGSATFTDPSTGDPSLVIQQTTGRFVAFDAICPHAGCTVAYQSGADIIACPCHGSEFNPANGDVIQGPATYGLTPIKVILGSEREPVRRLVGNPRARRPSTTLWPLSSAGGGPLP